MFEKYFRTSRRFKIGGVIFSLLGITAVGIDGMQHDTTADKPKKTAPVCTGTVFGQPPAQTDGSLIYVFPLIDGRIAGVSNVHGEVVSGVDAGMKIVPAKYENHGDLGYVWDVSTKGLLDSQVKVEGELNGQPFNCRVQEMTFNPKTGELSPSAGAD